MEYKRGDRIAPCRTPWLILNEREVEEFRNTAEMNPLPVVQDDPDVSGESEQGYLV